ncbi:MAG: hypothetical protein U0S36_02500 [Candidatus Nanopelagicales bacterium]
MKPKYRAMVLMSLVTALIACAFPNFAEASAQPVLASTAQDEPVAYTDALSAALGGSSAVIPGGRLGVWTVCPAGFGASVLLEWAGAYDTNEPGAYPAPGRVTRANPGTVRTFTVLRVPMKLGNGRTTEGRPFYVRVGCSSPQGQLKYTNSETVRVVKSSGYPEVDRWGSATRPVRLTLSAPATASTRRAFVVKVRATNLTSKRWRGSVGFAVYPTSETNFSLGAFKRVTRSGNRVPVRFVQSFPGGRSPSYRVVRTIRPGRSVTVRFVVVAGSSIYRYLELGAMRGTTALGAAPRTSATVALS